MTSTHAYRRRSHGPYRLEGSHHIPLREISDEAHRLRIELEEGASFILTSDGVPIGKLTPLNEPRVIPAQSDASWEDLVLEPASEGLSVMEVLDELRED